VGVIIRLVTAENEVKIKKSKVKMKIRIFDFWLFNFDLLILPTHTPSRSLCLFMPIEDFRIFADLPIELASCFIVVTRFIH
jgi:hypothetical protein